MLACQGPRCDEKGTKAVREEVSRLRIRVHHTAFDLSALLTPETGAGAPAPHAVNHSTSSLRDLRGRKNSLGF